MTRVTNSSGQKPVYSVIIPVYNADRSYFTQCIQSVIQQTLSNIEIIIVDDGSQKKNAEWYDEISRNDSRIFVIHQENMGVSAARNNGIDAARADWIMFVDADDWIEIDTCEKIYPYLCSRVPDILLFDHFKEYLDGEQRKQETGLVSNTLYQMSDIETKEKLYYRAMSIPNFSSTGMSTIYYSWDKVFSKQFLQENNLRFPVGLPKSEDKVFILQCFEKMHALMYIKKAFYHYRSNKLSESHRYSKHIVEERRALSVYLEKIAKRMDNEISELKEDPSYHEIEAAYHRFMFGIISDILFSKFYHDEYPGGERQRKEEVNAFLNSEPYKTAIKSCGYRDLGVEAKLKKFMLLHGLTSVFCNVRKAKKRVMRQLSQ